MPHTIEQYLHTLDDEEAEKIYPFVHEHIGQYEVDKLILHHHRSDQCQYTERIIALLSNLKSADSLTSAKNAVLHNDHEPDAPILLACATSLARNGGQDSIQAILERLNRVPLDDSGDVPENAVLLINTLTLVSAPELEWFIGQAAEGKWIASNTASRMAAISALRSFPNIHTTSILARLKNEDESPLLQDLATDVLARIQHQGSE